MQLPVTRSLQATVIDRMRHNPAVAILGPRQCGKTTLARQIVRDEPDAAYLDLERSADRAKLTDPWAYFDLHRDHLVCLDEVQRVPDLFPELRGILDRGGHNGQVLVLGSASRDLIRQSAESLAGRISYLELTPFRSEEVQDTRALWLRGGFPRSTLAEDDAASLQWREDFIRTFLERDLGLLAPRLEPARLGRLWRMCAHLHGSLLNSAKLGDALGVTGNTVRSWLELLEGAFMVRLLEPDASNAKKRLVKSPRLYLRDSGILHALLRIRSHDDLLGHPVYGSSFEGFAIENIIAAAPGWDATFYRTAAGAEMDLVLRRGKRTLAFEFKATSAPKLTRGFWNALEDLEPDRAFVVAPVDEPWPLSADVLVAPLVDTVKDVAGECEA